MKMHIALYTWIITAVLLAACGTTPSGKTVAGAEAGSADTLSSLLPGVSPDHFPEEDTLSYEYATYFVVVADTGSGYYTLREKMLALSKRILLPVDTMGRYYNAAKNRIALPDDDEDEIYAGDYFPRRFPSDHLSLEYLSFYQEKAGENTMALLAGIYENEESADSALKVLQKAEKKAFRIKADIYIGCMH